MRFKKVRKLLSERVRYLVGVNGDYVGKFTKERDELLENIIAEIRSFFRKEVNDYTVGRNYGLLMAILIIEQYKGESEG